MFSSDGSVAARFIYQKCTTATRRQYPDAQIMSAPELAATIPAASETLDEILARHRKESRDLVATRKKKEVHAKCEQMECDLKARHESELAAANNTGSHDIPNTNDGHVTEEEVEDEISPDKLLEQLALDVSTPADPEPAPREQQQPQKKGPKKNRQKDRLARKKAAIDQMTAEAALEAAKIPDLRKIELENIKALTDKLGLIQYDIVPDGHCLPLITTDTGQSYSFVERVFPYRLPTAIERSWQTTRAMARVLQAQLWFRRALFTLCGTTKLIW
ncbi:hypothetical protein V1515DRAFT_595339 [Lipomyces mesembrius]